MNEGTMGIDGGIWISAPIIVGACIYIIRKRYG